MTDLHDKLAAKGVKFLGTAGPGRVVGQRGAVLVALTKDGKKEFWRHRLPTKKKGFVWADKQIILWNAGGERRLIAVAAADGRKLYALEGEWAQELDGDHFLSTKGDDTGFLRRTENGALILSLGKISGAVN